MGNSRYHKFTGQSGRGVYCPIGSALVRMTMLAFVAMGMVFSTPLLAAVYYVSASGNDSAPGTIDQPFLSISKAYSKIGAGDTIYVRGGLYSLSATISLSNKSGVDSTKRCYLVAYPGERPVLDFTAQTSSDGLTAQPSTITPPILNSDTLHESMRR
jgi:hypothetical protein